MRTKDKPVWIRKADGADLNRLKALLALRDGRTVSTPEALGEAIHIALAELESDIRALRDNWTLGSETTSPRQPPSQGFGARTLGPEDLSPEDDLKITMPDGSVRIVKRKYLISGPVVGVSSTMLTSKAQP